MLAIEVFTGVCYLEASDKQLDLHRETLGKLGKDGNAYVLLTEEMQTLQFKDEDLLKIHSAIHSGESEVTFQGNKYKISAGKSGCKMVRIKGIT
jgi:hypothetical protein